MGDFEAGALALVESTLKYHPCSFDVLTYAGKPGGGHCLVGSLTGAVASQNVTEASKGLLRLIGNQPLEYKCISELDCESDGSSRCESRY